MSSRDILWLLIQLINLKFVFFVIFFFFFVASSGTEALLLLFDFHCNLMFCHGVHVQIFVAFNFTFSYFAQCIEYIGLSQQFFKLGIVPLFFYHHRQFFNYFRSYWHLHWYFLNFHFFYLLFHINLLVLHCLL